MAKRTKGSEEKTDGFLKLKAAIREKNIGNLYFFYGEETFLMQHYLGQIRKLLLDELTESFNFHKLTNENFDLQTLADCVENLPMMAEHSLVWVDEIDIFKLPESDREKLTQIFSDIPDYCTLLFTYVTTPWKPDKRFKKLYDAISANGLEVEFAKQEQRDLIPWITRHFAAHQRRITPDLCAYLIEITGGTMTALAGEIDKICAYSGAENIVKSDIDAVVEPVLEADAFAMADMLIRGECAKALDKLHTLLNKQQEPLMILGAVGKRFRQMASARILMDNGRGPGELMRICGMKDYPARLTMDAAGKFPAAFYKKAAMLVLETDRQLKTSYDDPARLMEMLLLQLAQEAYHG